MTGTKVASQRTLVIKPGMTPEDVKKAPNATLEQKAMAHILMQTAKTASVKEKQKSLTQLQLQITEKTEFLSGQHTLTALKKKPKLPAI